MSTRDPHENSVPSSLATALRTATGGRWAHVRDAIRSIEPERFGPPDEELSREDYRAYTSAQLVELAKEPYARDGLLPGQGGTGDLGASVTAFEMLGHADLSLWVKAGVQFGLYAGAIANLGTQRHFDEHLPSMLDLSVPGCFAMSETGHGSDVQHLLTIATYDGATDELVIHTPSVLGRKARDRRWRPRRALRPRADP